MTAEQKARFRTFATVVADEPEQIRACDAFRLAELVSNAMQPAELAQFIGWLEPQLQPSTLAEWRESLAELREEAARA